MKTRERTKNRLGIDIGKVIMSPVVGGKSDTSFLSGGIDQAMRTSASPGAFSNIPILVKAFWGQVWLISKAGINVQRKTRLWLQHQRFYERTGISRNCLRFCLKRHEKAHHCQAIQITHFIDDRIDVLSHLRNVVPNLYLFGEQPRLRSIPKWITHVLNWNETLEAILEDIRLPASGTDENIKGQRYDEPYYT